MTRWDVLEVDSTVEFSDDWLDFPIENNSDGTY
jgi:hypothetical protein